jgi:hypothetical protein
LGEALVAFRTANGLDPNAASAPSWTCRMGPIEVRFPNFGWRRAAILRHDLHHVLVGYDCTMRGEFQMAAWEFAAGRFPHAAATLFCLPLVAAGLLWSPRAIWSAYRKGRNARSLYGIELTGATLGAPISAVSAAMAQPRTSSTRAADIISFCALIFRAFLIVSAPVVITIVTDCLYM